MNPLLRKLFGLEQWCVGYARISIEDFLAAPDQASFTWIRPARTTEILADPFAIEDDDELVILAERLDHRCGRGEIVALTPATPDRPPAVVRAAGHHLSYPFVIEAGADRLVLPEEAEAGRSALYRYAGGALLGPLAALGPPDALDATLLFHEDRWWLFCARRGDRPGEALHLFHAPALEGPFEPHPANPVVLDLARARPAGRIIAAGGRLLRPGQDSTKTYGGAITLSAIDVLTPEAYSERPVARIEPTLKGGYGAGIHTLDHTARHVLVDTKRWVFHPLAWLYKIRARLAQRPHGAAAQRRVRGCQAERGM